jgi:hypothetical protein
MNIIPFEPGDATRYFVGCELIESTANDALGCRPSTQLVCFIFGTLSGLTTWILSSTMENNYISFDEFDGAVGGGRRGSPFTQRAAYKVFLHLYGLQGDKDILDDLEARWRIPGDAENTPWREQLVPLMKG